MRKRLAIAVVWLLLVGLSPWRPVCAQAERELRLSMSRDWGFGGMGRIQGLFSMKATGPGSLVRVVFMIDDQTVGEDTEPPFKVQFSTDSYPAGMHSMSATGTTAGGGVLQSNTITAEFLSAGQAGKATVGIVVPLIALVVLLIGSMSVATLLSARRRGRVPLGQPRRYGPAGGAICARCGRPFPLSILGLNLGLGKLSVCPHCGKWAVVRSRPMEELRAAEAAELERAGEKPQVPEQSEEEKLRRELDESRYQDL